MKKEREDGNKKNPKFFADAMLGHLATWLRVLGCDVKYEREIDDGELVERAEREDRIILTRDTLLLKRRGARGRGFFVEGDHLEEQLRQVVERFGLGRGGFLSRCLKCNTPLAGVEKTSIKGTVPPYVYETQKVFSRCPRCGRVYWGGTHRKKMLDHLSGILRYSNPE